MTLIPGCLYKILDEKRFIFHQCRPNAAAKLGVFFRLKFDTSKPVLFLTEKTQTITKLEGYSADEDLVMYDFLIESKIISFICGANINDPNSKKYFLSSITRIN